MAGIPTQRVASIDVLRGLTILVMIFVNDLAGVASAPAWMKHISPSDADGMTFVDVVFPAFLFIVGMSIPFSVGTRLRKGESMFSVWKHILVRTVALLIIGVFMVNQGSLGADGALNNNLWILLMYCGVILTWNVGKIPQRRGVPWFRLAGIALLIAAAILFRGQGERSFIELRPQWWGILGLIGWAYLVSCIFYIPLRRQVVGVLGVAAVLYCVFFADQAGLFGSWTLVTQWVSIGSMLGSHAAITLSGVVLGMILDPESSVRSQNDKILWGLIYGAGLALAAVLLHSLNGIHKMFFYNKIAATPPWCLLSSAFTVWIWTAVHWLVDVKGWRKWTLPFAPAGANALFAYILAPILLVIIQMISIVAGMDVYHMLGTTFATGFWRSVVFAFAVTWLAGGLRKAGIWLRL